MVQKLSFEAIGTRWLISLFDIPDLEVGPLKNEIFKRIEEFDQNYSRFRPDSWVSRISERAGKYKLPADAKPVFDLYRDLYAKTNGLFSPLIGRLMEQFGYDADYSLKPRSLSSPPLWESLGYDYPFINTKVPILLDVGAMGKGYLVDIVSDIVRSYEIDKFVVDSSGDILLNNLDIDYKVGLEDPSDLSRVIGIVRLKNGSLCSSAGSRRTWGKYHHLVNPKSLKSSQLILASWVIADTTILADAIATCLFFVDPAILKCYDFEFLILKPDRSFSMSKNFPGEIFQKNLQQGASLLSTSKIMR